MSVLRHDIALAGCSPEPLVLDGLHTGSLGHYLAALGVLHASVGMNGCANIRGCWKNDRFSLYGNVPSFNRETLSEYLLKWKPAPFERWWKREQEESKKNPDAIPALRASVTDDRVNQLDAVIVQADKQRVFNDMFLKGGKVGKRNLESTWKKCLKLSQEGDARSWLEHALFGTDAVLPNLSGAGTWFVFSNKTFNSGQDWYREGRLSPWSFLLAMEGALLLCGGVHRRLGTQARGKAVFPFMCRPADPLTEGQVAQGKCEFWAPLWNKPATITEIEALFRGGLAEIGGRAASAPHEFAVAALDAAVDTGISGFIRFDFRQTTSAQVFEALPKERVNVGHYRELRYSQLLLPLIEEHWIDRLPYEPKDSKQRGKFVGLRGSIEAGIVHLSEDPDDPERWRNLLLLIAQTQLRIDRNQKLRERCIPVPRLHVDWFHRAWPDPPPELRVARAIASIQDLSTHKNGAKELTNPLLVNVFGVEIAKGFSFFPKARPNRTVWHEGNPVSGLIEILRRRLLDANELDLPPLRGSWPSSIDVAACYLAGGHVFDDELMAQWLPPLTLIDWRKKAYCVDKKDVVPDISLHPLYSLFRPLFDAENFRVHGELLFPSDESDSRRPHTASIRRIVNLLLQNEINEAVAHVRRRYLGVGWRTFEPPAGEMVLNAERLVAALLIPVNAAEVAARFHRDWLLLPTTR